jgi:glutathione peroxidase
MTPIEQIPFHRADGAEASLADYQGQVRLLVNVASACGLTPQYEKLESLYEAYRDKGLTVIGFPANEFGAQEPGTDAEIQQFCQTSYGVQFPVMAKLVVKGEGQHPLYQALTQAVPEADDLGDGTFAERLAGYGIKQDQPGDVLWNFEKFLVDRQGQIVARFSPGVVPDAPQVVQAIEAALSQA